MADVQLDHQKISEIKKKLGMSVYKALVRLYRFLDGQSFFVKDFSIYSQELGLKVNSLRTYVCFGNSAGLFITQKVFHRERLREQYIWKPELIDLSVLDEKKETGSRPLVCNPKASAYIGSGSIPISTNTVETKRMLVLTDQEKAFFDWLGEQKPNFQNEVRLCASNIHGWDVEIMVEQGILVNCGMNSEKNLDVYVLDKKKWKETFDLLNSVAYRLARQIEKMEISVAQSKRPVELQAQIQRLEQEIRDLDNVRRAKAEKLSGLRTELEKALKVVDIKFDSEKASQKIASLRQLLNHSPEMLEEVLDDLKQIL